MASATPLKEFGWRLWKWGSPESVVNRLCIFDCFVEIAGNLVGKFNPWYLRWNRDLTVIAFDIIVADLNSSKRIWTFQNFTNSLWFPNIHSLLRKFQILALKLLTQGQVKLIEVLNVGQTQTTVDHPCNPSHPDPSWDDPLKNGSQISKRGTFYPW
jgi:hypothetical protein